MRSWVEGQTQHSGRRQTDTQKHSCPERQPFLIPLLLTRARLPPRPHPAVCSGIPGPHQNPKGQLYPRPRVGPLVICFMLLPQHSLSDHSIPSHTDLIQLLSVLHPPYRLGLVTQSPGPPCSRPLNLLPLCTDLSWSLSPLRSPPRPSQGLPPHSASSRPHQLAQAQQECRHEAVTAARVWEGLPFLRSPLGSIPRKAEQMDV